MALRVVDPYTQLRRGLIIALVAALDGLVPANNVGAGYPLDEMARALDGQTDHLPVVRVLIGDSVTASDAAVGASTRRVIPVIAPGQTSVDTLYEDRTVQTALTLYVVAGDPHGASQRDEIATALGAALSPSGSTGGLVPLPDGPPYTPDWALGPRVYGLTARLIAGMTRPDPRYIAQGLYKSDMPYMARHSRYIAETFPVASGVTPDFVFTIVRA